MPVQAEFLPVDPGQRLCLIHVPGQGCRGVVVHVPAFAEEMNKSRRQVALAARALAEAGFAVVVPDLYGCGDSSGDFGEATWERWQRDVGEIGRWAAARFGGPLWLWGLRAGALLAVSVADSFPGSHLLLWQPVASGKLYLTQFLRLKVANDALAEAAARAGTKEIQARLMAGNTEEIAGYGLSPAMARGLDQVELVLPAGFSGRVAWIEAAAVAVPELMPRSQSLIADWRGRGISLAARAVNGPSFWQTLEISECPAMIDATVDKLRDGA